jgi:hypothetical protein
VLLDIFPADDTRPILFRAHAVQDLGYILQILAEAADVVRVRLRVVRRQGVR